MTYTDRTHRNLTCDRSYGFRFNYDYKDRGTVYVTFDKDCTITYFSRTRPAGGKVAPSPDDYKPISSSTGFSCSMDGFTDMIIKITELLLIAISMYKEIWVAILPANLALSLKYAYQGLSGVSSWVGYAMAALFYIAED